MNGFLVDVTAVRAGATQVEATASQVTTMAGTAGAGAGPATGSNPGFYISEVLGMLTNQVSVATRAAGTDLRAFADALKACADGYDEVERANKRLFDGSAGG